jgi:acyl carrier protein
MELPDEFQGLIVPRCRFIESADQFSPRSPLTELGVDSLEIVELIIDIEDTYGIEFPQELLTPEVFTSAETIWRGLCDVIAGHGDRVTAGS